MDWAVVEPKTHKIRTHKNESNFLRYCNFSGIPVIGCECEVCNSTDKKDTRLRVSVLIEKDDKRIVIDVGPDFRQQMLQYNAKELHGIIITHEHNDHVAGLDDVRPYNFRYQKDMPVYALPRVADHIESRFDYIFMHQPYPGAPKVDLKHIKAWQQLNIEGFEIECLPVMHGPLPILGFKIGQFAYLTDVKTLEDKVIEQVKGIDTLVISSLRQAPRHFSHLTLEEALVYIEKIQPKRAYLTHFSHLLGKHSDVSKILPEHVFLAYDGLALEI